jgi:molybdopterin-synthase adenylyltransferase
MKDLSRQGFLGNESDAVLAASTAGIVGLCGGGSHVAQQLAHIGIGRFVLCDPDVVEPSNLNRMVGATAADAETSMTKVEVVSQRILAINPSAEIVLCTGNWQEYALQLRDATAVFGCVDSYSERAQLETMSRRFLIPYIDVGMDVTETGPGYAISGQVILSMPGQPCMRCLGFLTDDLLTREAQRYGNAGGKPQVVWPNGVLASIAVGKFVSLILPWQGYGTRPSMMTEYDGNAGELFTSRRLKALGARPCMHFSGSDDLGDPFFRL